MKNRLQKLGLTQCFTLALLLGGCGKGPNAGKGFDLIPTIFLLVCLVGFFWFIGQLVDKKSKFVDSVVSGLITTTLVAAVVSLLIKLFS